METIPANAAEGIDAKLQVRGSCHGKSGVPINAATPIIWGQQEFFLVVQLHDYYSEDRKTPIMAAFANYSGAIFRIGITAFAQLSFHLSVIADHSLICA
jgi:hypothetical protein